MLRRRDSADPVAPEGGSALTLLVTFAVALVVAYPACVLLLRSFFDDAGHLTVRNWWHLLSSTAVQLDLARTVAMAACAALLGTFVGLAMAAMSVRTDFAGRWLLRIAAIGPAITSQTLTATAWVIIADPGNGWLNSALRMAGLGITADVFTPAGLTLVMALLCLPVAFLIGESLLSTADGSREESARICGAGRGRVWFRIVLPLIAPGAAALFLVCFAQCAIMFSAHAAIGMPASIGLLTTRLYTESVLGLVPKGQVAATGGLLVVLAVVALSIQYKLAKPSSTYAAARVNPPARRRLRGFEACLATGAAFAALGLLLVLPIATLGVRSLWPFGPWMGGTPSLEAYARVLGEPALLRGLAYSTCIGAGVALLTACVAFYAVRASALLRHRMGPALHGISVLPLGLSGLVIGSAYLIAFAGFPASLQDPLVLLVFALTARELPVAYKASELGFAAVHRDLVLQARVCGAGVGLLSRRIVLPLVKPTLAGGMVVVFLAAFREIEISSLLSSLHRESFGYNVFSLLQGGRYQDLGAMAILGLCVCLIVTLPLGWLARRRSF